jgi:tetratricopeptide (TPR) repeat protein
MKSALRLRAERTSVSTETPVLAEAPVLAGASASAETSFSQEASITVVTAGTAETALTSTTYSRIVVPTKFAILKASLMVSTLIVLLAGHVATTAALANSEKKKSAPVSAKSDNVALAAQYYRQAKQAMAARAEGRQVMPFLDKAIQLNPNVALYYETKVQVLQELQEDDQLALACAERACSINPKDHWAWQLRAGALILLNRYTEALTAINHAEQIGPSDGNVHNDKAKILEHLANYPAAAVAATKAVYFNPKSSDYRVERAKIRMQLKNYAGVVEDTAVVIADRKQFQLHYVGYILRAHAFAAMNNNAAATATYLSALKKVPDDRQMLVEAKRYFSSISDRVHTQTIDQMIKGLDEDIVPFK